MRPMTCCVFRRPVVPYRTVRITVWPTRRRRRRDDDETLRDQSPARQRPAPPAGSARILYRTVPGDRTISERCGRRYAVLVLTTGTASYSTSTVRITVIRMGIPDATEYEYEYEYEYGNEILKSCHQENVIAWLPSWFSYSHVLTCQSGALYAADECAFIYVYRMFLSH